MITLLHTADLHLGQPFPGLGEKGRDHREQLKRTFARVVDLALEVPVQLVLIAGDLFHAQRESDSTLAFVRDQFQRLRQASIRVALIAGNHDRLGEDTLWTRARFSESSENVTLFGADPSAAVFPDLDLTVVGRSVGPDGPQPLAGWPRGRATRFAVGVAHGSAYREGVVEDGVIHPADIQALGLDYLALGDWHTPQQVVGPPTPAWYAGSPEYLAMDQEGGQVLLVRIPEPGRAEVVPHRVGRRRYRRLDLDVSGVDPDRVRALVAAEADPDVVLDVALTGTVAAASAADLRDLEEALQDRCFRLRVRDQRRLWLDDEALEAFPERTLVGRYVRLIRAHAADAAGEDRELLEEALQVGVAMLLSAEVA